MTTMKLVAVLMVVIGAAVGAGAVLEIVYYPPGTPQFLAGVIAAPASAFFSLAGILLWRQGLRVRRTVLLAALAMATATVATTALDVMGIPATLLGIFGAFVATGVALRPRGFSVTG